jgi:hypothetical protein
MISDPVAMEVDENGNIYVVEMHGYPLDTAGSGVIKLLTDTNGDGVPDKSVAFADRLRLPTGVMKWKKGILVVDVPDILYFEDGNAIRICLFRMLQIIFPIMVVRAKFIRSQKILNTVCSPMLVLLLLPAVLPGTREDCFPIVSAILHSLLNPCTTLCMQIVLQIKEYIVQ